MLEMALSSMVMQKKPFTGAQTASARPDGKGRRILANVSAPNSCNDSYLQILATIEDVSYHFSIFQWFIMIFFEELPSWIISGYAPQKNHDPMGPIFTQVPLSASRKEYL